MPSLLHLDSSADPSGSTSRALTAAFAEAFLAADPHNVVVHRDLHADPLPHLADASLHWPERLRSQGAHPPADDASLQQVLIDELLAADVLVVGAPLYNYSLPSSLKAWVDHVHVPGVTAPFDVASQPLAGRPAVVVSSRGASYDPGSPTADWDHAVPVLQIVLGSSFGMTVSVVTTSLTLASSVPALADELPRSRAEYAAALTEVTRLGGELGRPA